jgi:hypothetical protein
MTLVEGGSTQELTRVYEAALAEVNRLRVRDGLDKIERLPKGTRSAPVVSTREGALATAAG